MPFNRRIGFIVVLAFLAALIGVFIGRAAFETQSKTPGALHDVVHQELELSPQQEAQIARLETEFAVRRKALELEIKADNARLAEAIAGEHGYGPRVTSVVDRHHAAMGQLQKETLSHIFAMRGVLNSDQARKFDRAVTEALTADPK